MLIELINFKPKYFAFILEQNICSLIKIPPAILCNLVNRPPVHKDFHYYQG